MNPARKRARGERGIALVEVMIYVFIFALVSVVVVNMLLSLGRAYRSMQASLAIENTAQIAMERIVREVRGASGILDAESVYNTANGVLALDAPDGSGGVVERKFLLTGGRIHIEEGGIDLGPLSPDSVTVESLVFRRLSSAQSSAVRIEMTVGSVSGAVDTEMFYSTAVVRSSYLLK